MLKLFLLIVASSTTTVPLDLSVIHDGEGRTFTAAIVDQNENGKSDRSINIVCSSGCRIPSSLTESFSDEPLGIFKLSDQNNVIYVTASAGSSYKISAYLLTEKRILKILDKSSLSAPKIFTNNNFEQVTITKHISEKSYGAISQTFIWNGGTFTAK